MLTLAQLRAKQTGTAVGGEAVVEQPPGICARDTQTIESPPTPAPVKPVEESAPIADRGACPSTPIQGLGNEIRKADSSADLTATRGYLKIFPPKFASINQVPDDFKKEFWTTASPWCRIEGVEDHPDFENNLKIIENT